MSKTHYEQPYRCWNDCVMQGCPGHIATLDYQSVSDALALGDGKGQKFYIQTPELEAIAIMLDKLRYRVEIKAALEALSSKDGLGGVSVSMPCNQAVLSELKALLNRAETISSLDINGKQTFSQFGWIPDYAIQSRIAELERGE